MVCSHEVIVSGILALWPCTSFFNRCGKGTMESPTAEDLPAPEVVASGSRDWSKLPLDALASVFGKLRAVEILMGAGLVCDSWLEAAKVPELWRSVFMVEPKINHDALRAMAKVAADRSAGQLEFFAGEKFVTDELLKYIGDRYLASLSCHSKESSSGHYR